MRRRLRGHYRIDRSGQIELLADVNAGVRSCVPPNAENLDEHGQFRTRLNRRSVAGVGIFIMGISMLFAMPLIEQAMLCAQSATVASTPADRIQNHSGLTSMLDHLF